MADRGGRLEHSQTKQEGLLEGLREAITGRGANCSSDMGPQACNRGEGKGRSKDGVRWGHLSCAMRVGQGRYFALKLPLAAESHAATVV